MQNSVSTFPSEYYCRHLQAGLCGYAEETILLPQSALEKMAKTFNGKPIYIHHKDVDFDAMKQEAVGYVAETWCDMDGWMWSKIILIDDEAKNAVAQGWSVSNAYNPTEYSGGGMHHNIRYDREITDASFTHLAIVQNPRYEEAKIYTTEQFQARNTQLMNSLENQPKKEGSFFMKFWKTEKKEVSPAEAETVEYKNAKGETVTKTIEEMKNALEEKVKEEEEDKKEKENEEQKVTVAGKEMTVAELCAAYEKLMAAEDAEKAVLAEAENEDEEEGKEKEEEAKALENAERQARPAPAIIINSREAQLTLGKQRYGTV